MPRRRLTAAWVVPMEGPPIPRGAVLVGDDGRIEAIGSDTAVPAPPGTPQSDHSDSVLLPGLVNTHTHLELTGFEGQVPEDDFSAWIRRVRSLKAERKPTEFLEAARRGLAACYSAGVTTVADTGDSGAVIEALHEAGGSGIAYHEVFGPHPDQLLESLAGLQRRVDELRRFASGRIRLGVSPHAPYTVSAPLYMAVARWAEREGLPIAVHLAESLAESELLASASGAFAEAWTARGIPLPPLPGRSPVAWLESHGVLGPSTLAIHAVQVDAADVARLALHGAAVAHCPLSNRRHGHGEAPLRSFLNAGIRIGIGTDSVASVGSLDLLAEARAASALAGLDAEQALALVTREAARALGLEDEVGVLRRGAWADIVAIGIPTAATPNLVYEAAVASNVGDVQETLLGGRTVYRRAAAP
ncbi:MAG TPA: amidohydrolase family protein [Gemmatimonadales bacterium]|nr:amidohydrolase family protein [Gemmatimonadales bacterium]